MTSKNSIKLTVADLKKIAPNAKTSILRGIVRSFSVLEEYGIAKTQLRLAHFLAQAALETAGFRTLQEYGSSSYFRRRYGRRKDLGNRNRADGAAFHGRGIFQLTGRANYRRYGRLIKVDLESKPHLAARPDISLRIACEYWNSKKLSVFADANNIRKITKRINGGYNGLQGRKRYFARALKVLAGKDFSSQPKTKPVLRFAFQKVLRRGMFGSAVKVLQQALSQTGFSLQADGIFGSGTRSSLIKFQTKYKLPRDGVLGKATARMLDYVIHELPTSSNHAPQSVLRSALIKPKPVSSHSKKRINIMVSWKSYLESRTMWANFIGFIALLLSAFGLPTLGVEDQAALIDGILKLIEASGFIMGAYFRYIAHDQLST